MSTHSSWPNKSMTLSGSAVTFVTGGHFSLSTGAVESKQFAGVPLVLGSAHGARSWNLDSVGRLYGVSYTEVWTPGENVATCLRTGPGPKCRSGKCGVSVDPSTYPSAYSQASGGMMVWAPESCDREPDPCSGFEDSCGCGFWAYYDKPHWDAGSSPVTGVIEGYGKTTLGTKGFRCEKARILAITFAKTCPETKKKLARRNYPDVAVYPSQKAMLREFPLSEAYLPGPDEDPEFWTREIGLPTASPQPPRRYTHPDDGKDES